MRKNGVSRPEKNGNVKQVWDVAEEIFIRKKSAPLREEVVEACFKLGIPEGTSKTQYSNWCRFNGVDSRAVNKKEKAPA